MPTTHLGRYEIIGDLGRGAMGMVFQARDPLIDRRIAIKTVVCYGLDGDDGRVCEQRFFREAKCAGRLNHPNIVTVHDVGRDGEVAYIVMEFLRGRTLRELLDAGVVLDADRIADIAAQVAEGLACAHANDVVHCDIKPGNVMVLDNGCVKVADFGVAALPSGSLAEDGTAIGSPKYMSPEQVSGQRLDGRSDIFSLGAVLYEMLAGSPPFSGDELGAILQQVMHFDPVAPSSRRSKLNPGFDIIVAKAMAKDPDQRYRSAAEMALDLRRYRELSAQPVEATRDDELTVGQPPKTSVRGAAPPRPRRIYGAAAAMATVLLAVVAVRYMQPEMMRSPTAAPLALASAEDGRSKNVGAKKASSVPAVANTAKADAMRKAPIAAKRKQASGQVKTREGDSDHQFESASPQQQAMARDQSAASLTSRVAAVPAPARATSPEQLCADRVNFMSRGFCEVRLCMQADWRDHAYCVKKREQDMRSNPLLATSG